MQTGGHDDHSVACKQQTTDPSLRTGSILNPGASEEAIQHHYDVGNEFYRLWLGPTLTYSSALWEQGDDLDAAQLRKLDYHIGQSCAGGAKQVLDIGCGWGSILKRLVDHHGVQHAVGLTLSQSQAAWIKTVDDPRIEARLESWSEHTVVEPYDAIISIGAFEHFARLGATRTEKIVGYRQFFERCHHYLRPGGRMSLQTIVYENFDERDSNPFVAEIFPESDLPRLADVVRAGEGLFEIVRLRNDRKHYADTLRAWYAALKMNRSTAVGLVGEEIVKKYEKYLGVFVVGFHMGTVNLSRITLQRIDRPRTAIA